MEQSRRYNTHEVYGETFLKLPKVFFSSNKYQSMSNDAKIAYTLLKDRFNYSVKNDWVDKNGDIYFIFTNEELMNLLNVHKDKVIKVKKELEKTKLLEQERLGLNKPNHLYLLRPEVTAKDVYKQISAETVDNNGSRKNRHNLYKEHKDSDTNRYNIDTQKLNFSTANFSPAEINKQNRDLVSHANDFLTDPDSGLEVFLEPEAVQLLSFWCRTPQQMHRFIGIILNAKYAVEKEHRDLGVWIALDDPELKPLMTKTLRRYFNALRSNEKHIKNVENYLYGTMQNLFGIWWNKQAAKQYQKAHPEETKNPQSSGWA
ncbi:plasmid replication initiation protein [Lentilactobacillus buchneri]|uniref:replication initiator protein A n=1 Tax=Lentilactobacillus buchneri TaxID=1581 RepID=UPI0021A7C6CC|nr:replication initiator protein A [Lentilactobacillus buchneri]MCT3561012.1 plasmid replication initiation protein [Lentilactobacillus buchneri]